MAIVEDALDIGEKAARVSGAAKTLEFGEQAIQGLTGTTAERAALEAAALQAAGAERGAGFLEPFQQVGQLGVEQAGFLTDPQAQFQFLQENPLFQMALEQAGRETKGMAAARGRLSAGDTLQQLSKNVLMASSPLITRQQQGIQSLLGVGERAGAGLADLATGGSAAEAAGVIGAGQARTAGAQNILHTALLAGGAFGGAPTGVPTFSADPTINQALLAGTL